MTDTVYPQTPDMADLLTTVRAFLTDLGTELTGERRYQAQVADFLLSICERELSGHRQTVDVADLCAAIRDGRYDDDWNAVLGQMLENTIAAVQITRPDHLDPMHRKAAP